MYFFNIGYLLVACIALARCGRHPNVHSTNSTNVLMPDSNYTTDYVGRGYDAVFGNPFGSSSRTVDSGYRNSIIDRSEDAGYESKKAPSSDLVWQRELSTCWHSDEREGMCDDDIMKELKDEFQMEGTDTNDLLEANIRNSFDSDKTLVTSAKYRVTNAFCAIREGGMILPFKGKLSTFFIKDLGNVPEKIDGLKVCSADVYLAEPMKEECKGIDKWIKFFKRYGTHVTTHAVTGGHIIYIDNMASVNNSAKNEENMSAGVNVSTKHNFNRTLSGSRESSQMWIIGGYYAKGLESNSYSAFRTWSQNVWKRPMPIRGSFASLEHFVGDKAKAYADALQFYRQLQSVANGHSLNYYTFYQMIKEMTAVTANDPLVHCPDGMVVVAGFVISKNIPMDIDSCVTSRTFCSSDVIRNNAFSMALCSKPGSFTMSMTSTSKRSCPGDSVVAAGFQLYFDDSLSMQLTPCPTGSSTLVMNYSSIGKTDCGEMPGNLGVEWKICVPRRILESRITVFAGGVRAGENKLISCQHPQKVTLGKSTSDAP
ncbi:hypothetical protein BgAZ_102120 [Babesia gibsoni]|uniref:MACPF domain-containing protein n=1 Tax=Babesia gibsoni TaxID=33632 RepID=A0AAD8PFA1_BABGI|nr:hypothetical protein BgAZ_102120 [Babesia gibsoni]